MDLTFRDTEIDGYESMIACLKALFRSHPYLAPLEYYLDLGECGFDVVDSVGDILRDAKEGAYRRDNTVRFSDCVDDVENYLEPLVSYNNDPWNFAPGGDPPEISWKRAVLLVRAILGQEGLLRLELDTTLGPPVRRRGVLKSSQGPARLAVMIRGRSRVTVEEWTWPEEEGYREGVRTVSRHKDASARVTKSFEGVVSLWEKEDQE